MLSSIGVKSKGTSGSNASQWHLMETWPLRTRDHWSFDWVLACYAKIVVGDNRLLHHPHHVNNQQEEVTLGESHDSYNSNHNRVGEDGDGERGGLVGVRMLTHSQIEHKIRDLPDEKDTSMSSCKTL